MEGGRVLATLKTALGVIGALALAGLAAADDVKDAAAVPGLGEAGRAAYASFLAAPPARAFAVAEGGAFGWSSRRDSRMLAVFGALYACNKTARDVCRVYAVNDDVVVSRYTAFDERSRLLRRALAAAPLKPVEYGDEAKDYGVASPDALRRDRFHAPTPLALAGVRTVMTVELVTLLAAATPPLLIDVLEGDGHKTLPGAWWIRGAGNWRSADTSAEIGERLGFALAGLTRGDKNAPLAFFCLSSECWLSYNAALRARTLGYTAVSWYRGGVKAWEAAGLDLLDAVQHGQLF